MFLCFDILKWSSTSNYSFYQSENMNLTLHQQGSFNNYMMFIIVFTNYVIDNYTHFLTLKSYVNKRC